MRRSRRGQFSALIRSKNEHDQLKKLHTLKRWLTLDDAAMQLSHTTTAVVKATDVLQLCLEGHLSLAWNIAGKPATKISSYTQLSNWYSGTRHDPTHQRRIDYAHYLPYSELRDDEPPQTPAFHTFYRVTAEPDEIQYLRGTFKLCLEPNIDIELREWLTFLVTGSDEHTELVGMLGCVTVEDDQGQKWSILKLASNDSTTLEPPKFLTRRSTARSKDGSTPEPLKFVVPTVLRRRLEFNRTDDFPPIKSLVIWGDELERLEKALADDVPALGLAAKLRGTERSHYLKVIAGLLTCAGISRQEAVTEVQRILEGKGGQTKLDRATLSITLKDANKMRP
jgi:hypothetical protein